jgi:predicted nucleic acid-binding protein
VIVLDANVLISYWGRPDAHTADTYDILDTEDELLIHPITLAETLVAPVREGREDDALSAYARLGVERHDPTLDEPVRVARLRVETRLKLPDACVLAAAMEREASLATFDKRLADAARDRGVIVLGA